MAGGGEGSPVLQVEVLLNNTESIKAQAKQLTEKGKSKWEELLGRAQALLRN